jgi:hypothetical protein
LGEGQQAHREDLTRRGRLGLGLLAALVVAGAAPARAQPAPRVALRWVAPEGCPPADRVTSEVDRLLGDQGARLPAPLEVAASVTEAGGSFRVRLETPGASGPRVRELKAASCAALADATALIIAMMIDPAAVTAPPLPPSPPLAPAPAPAPAPLLLPVPVPAPSPRPAPPQSPPLRRSFHVLAWTLLDTGTLPGVAFAVGGAAALTLGPVRLELGAGVWPDRAATLAQRPTAGGNVSLVAGSAGLCYGLLRPGPFDLAPCAAFELGRLHAAGFGVSSPGEGSALWTAVKAGGLFAWAPVQRFAVLVRLDAAVPTARPSFVLEGVASGAVYRPGPVAGRASLGAEIRF